MNEAGSGGLSEASRVAERPDGTTRTSVATGQEIDPEINRSPPGLVRDALALLPHKRRRQLRWLGALMLLGALAESVTLGAVVPFIALLVEPARAFDYPRLQGIFGGLGWNDPSDLVLPMALGFVILIAFSTAIRLLVAWTTKRFSFAVGMDLGYGIYQRMLYQPYSFHARLNSGDVLGGINKAQAVATGLIMPGIRAISAAVIALGVMIMLLWINAGIAVTAALIFLSIYVLVTWLVRRRLRSNGRIIASANSDRIRYVQEGLGGIRDVILDGQQAWYLDKYARMERAFRTAQAQNAFVGEFPRHAIEGLGIILIVALAFWLTQARGGLSQSLPVLGAMVLGAQRLLPQAQTLFAAWTQVAGNHKVLADVQALLELPLPEPETGRHSEAKLPFENSISFENIGFRYEGQPDVVLQNFNLEISKGEKVVITGRTGSGKSTLTDLLMGLLVPTEGRILVDGVAITQDNRRAWQAHIAHVPQSIYLADASIAENIAFGMSMDDIDLPRVRECAEKAQLSGFIESLAGGYQTTVGERGARLSGGQRQRVGIARALYKNASVLVLDEATNALDSRTEQNLSAALDQVGQDMTIFIISHRPGSAAGCDRIVDLGSSRST